MGFDYAEFAAAFPWFFPIAAFVFGAVVGSFLNVCILRIPAGRSVVTPGSHCACGQPIAWHDNIPILSWLLLRGRARCCGRPFSARYPAIELLTGLLFLACWWQFPPAKAAVAMVFCALLIVATFVDLDHMIIPDRCSIGGAIAGVGLSLLVPSLHDQTGSLFLLASLKSVTEAVLGVLVGSGLVLWIALLAEVLLRKEAMGFGDVKLMGAIGAFCGWQGGVFAVFGGAILGVLFFAAWLLFRAVSPATPTAAADSGAPGEAAPPPGAEGDDAAPGEEEADSGPAFGVPVPFGPMLAAAALLYLLLLQPWVDDYFAGVAMLLRLE